MRNNVTNKDRSKAKRCNDCNAETKWLKTKSDSWALVNIETLNPGDDDETIFDPKTGHINHLDTCPVKNQRRQEKGNKDLSYESRTRPGYL